MIILGVFLFIIILFIICTLRISSICDEIDEKNKND